MTYTEYRSIDIYFPQLKGNEHSLIWEVFIFLLIHGSIRWLYDLVVG